MKIKNLRILHFLSPVKWQNDIFLADADANYKVMLKTIEFLPNCHHYIIAPMKINHKIYQKNVTYVYYDYPHSVFLNRYLFDFKKIRGLNLNITDVDYIFNHQPEQTLSLQVWFGTFRYYTDIKVFNFFHWIDCRKNKGGFCNVQPINFLRQYEATIVGNVNFFHNQQAVRYLKSNFKELEYQPEIKNVSYMPLSGKVSSEINAFPLPDKKIIVFNHRWNVSSGINRFLDYIEDLSDEYIIWVTDQKNCDIKRDNFIVKKLNTADFNYLMSNCYCNVTFIDAYSTWNLSAQDCILRNKPTLCYYHPTLKSVLGDDMPFYFKTKEDFKNKLKYLPEFYDNKKHLIDHDFVFKNNIINEINKSWKSTVNEPKNAHKYIELIEKGITTKDRILSIINPKVKASGSNHFNRRYLLNNGISDDINSAYTDYFIEDDPNTYTYDLFNLPE